jgi:hypothetical protein
MMSFTGLLIEVTLDSLAEQAFIRRPARQDPIHPEPAYLRDAISDDEGRTPEDDFPALESMLERITDADGLLSLGHTYAVNLERFSG